MGFNRFVWGWRRGTSRLDHTLASDLNLLQDLNNALDFDLPHDFNFALDHDGLDYDFA